MQSIIKMTTGLVGLDNVINSLRMGDNVVWQVDEIADYAQFAEPFAESVIAQGKRLVYMHFATHSQILFPGQYSVMYTIDPSSGFESFSAQIHNVVREEGEGIFYVFDCLSDLQSAWSSDLMIANFFVITCPYLYELNTIAYFALLRNRVSYTTIASIRETTQLLIDVYCAGENYYIHPLKVWERYSPTMFFPHLRREDEFIPITSSVDAAALVMHIQKHSVASTLRNLDFWDRTFLTMEDLIGSGAREEEKREMLDRLCRIILGRDRRMLALAMDHMTLEDFVDLKDRLVGTGHIGGKATGMIIARKILSRSAGLDWEHLSEPHDSFYIGSDVFYTYIVLNGWWKLFMEHKTDDGYYSAAEELHGKMRTGVFPSVIKDQFQEIIEYYGQSPIIVRSSSLLEDAFGNAFAGKYESFFLVNQGSPEERFQAFTDAVRKIYASTMNEDALAYRMQRGLDKMDEQMALLVQRVSGSYYERYYFPFMAGVGLSRNTYVWNDSIDPMAGMIRLVFGLGTRAVNRIEGDYPRIVSLDQPLLKVQAGVEDARKYSQRYADLLNVMDNQLQSKDIQDMVNEKIGLDLSRIARRDIEAEQSLRGGDERERWIVDFDSFLTDTPFSGDMSAIMKTLEGAYGSPVDIEFTVNISSDGRYRINLVQCRPQQAKFMGEHVDIPERIDPSMVLFRGKGNFLGGSIVQPIHRIVIVDPAGYAALPISQKHEVARIVGRLNRGIKDRDETPTMLVGPGRWGTTTPSLGIPVRFSEINNVRVLVEVALMSDGLVPEFSYGTHFFQDLVETEIFYVAMVPDSDGAYCNEDLMEKTSDSFEAIAPDHGRYRGVIRVYDLAAPLMLMADIVTQELVCFAT
ncbi:MAG: PEP/pyruvate-binding domain-containing protein [Spirochaetes bacterium]|nr:PEP/pyruvate-binding domain-containing protein [Spirochaetota bacterium]